MRNIITRLLFDVKSTNSYAKVSDKKTHTIKILCVCGRMKLES